jgi:hypothetical protein
MSADVVFFVFIFFSLAVIGAKKSWRWFDDKGEIKEASKQGALGLLGKIFKK